MSRERTDDPGQVLAILNSLGVVGVTASELKEFMRELKLYKKVKEKEYQQRKDKIKTKILQKQDCSESKHINILKSSVVQNTRTVHRQEVKRTKHTEKTQDYCTKVVVNKKQCNLKEEEKENTVDETTSPIPITIKYRRTSTRRKKENEKTDEESKEIKESPKCSVGTSEEKSTEKSIVRTSRRRSRSLTLSANSRRNKSVGSRSRSKSFIRSQTPYPECKSRPLNKKIASDPVALYNKYKSIWRQLSLPGEEAHVKLRWSVREKMLGSNPTPKPIIPPKKHSQLVPSTGRRKL